MTTLNPGSIGNPDEQPIVQLPPELAAFFERTRCRECDRINNTHTDDCTRAGR